MTQILAGGPQIVARWNDAKDAAPYAWAVLSAAIDATRLGARAPLPPDLLRAAAEGYCSSQQQAEAPNDWFEQALVYATRRLYGATAPLCAAGAGMGKVAGYTVADFLLHHVVSARRVAPAPVSTWDALLTHVQGRDDLRRIADSAATRGLHAYADPLYRAADAAGDPSAVAGLARSLVLRGDVDAVRTLAESGSPDAAMIFAGLLKSSGDSRAAVDILRQFSDSDENAGAFLTDLYFSLGDIQGLRARSTAGDSRAESLLIDLLLGRSDEGRAEAIRLLRRRADSGNISANAHLARLAAERGDLEEVQARAQNGDRDARRAHTDLLIQVGDRDAALLLLDEWADNGDGFAANRLARLLLDVGDREALRRCAARGNVMANRHLIGVLINDGEIAEAMDIARRRADAGDIWAADRFYELLTQRGDIEELRLRAGQGEWRAAKGLAHVLAEQNAATELRLRADAGDTWARHELADLLARLQNLDELKALAANAEDDDYIARALVRLLTSRRDVDGLRSRADTGDEEAASALATLLAAEHRTDELRTRADAGDRKAAYSLADLLVEGGDFDELRDRAYLGDHAAMTHLADHLVNQRNVEDLLELAAVDPRAVDWQIIDRLVGGGRLEGAQRLAYLRADAGDVEALFVLINLLEKHGNHDEATQIRLNGFSPDGWPQADHPQQQRIDGRCG